MQRLKVLLIFPPKKHAVRNKLLRLQSSQEASKPPLSILSLGTYLVEHSDHIVELWDMQDDEIEETIIGDRIEAFRPDIVGISAWTDFWYSVYRLIEIVKRVDTNIHVSLGGPHITVFPKLTLEASKADSIINGEGEIPFFNLVQNIASGKPLNNLPAVYFREHMGNVPEYHYFIHPNIDQLPILNRTLLPVKRYKSLLSKGSYVTTMATSRGCPFRCTFCKVSRQKTNFRSPENVVREFGAIQELGIREVEVYDDTFGISKERVKQICHGILENRIDLIWACRDRVSTVTPENLGLMRKAGCRRIHFGIESGSERILKSTKKNIRVAQAHQAVAMAKDAGMEVLTYFMLGFPEETPDDIRKTIDLIFELNTDYVDITITISYPGTDLYNTALATGRVESDFWEEFVRNPVPDFEIPFFWEDAYNIGELVKIRNATLRKFYFRPQYLLKTLRKGQTLPEFLKKTRIGLDMLKETLFH